MKNEPSESRRGGLVVLLATVQLLLLSRVVIGGETWWQCDPNITGDWFDANHWTNGLPGGTLYNAYIDNDGNSLISSGEINVYRLYVGYTHSGTVYQQGGSNDVSYKLDVGYSSGADGTYELSGDGELSADWQYLGFRGTGRLIQTGGSNTGSYLNLGQNSCGEGTYELSGDGRLSMGSGYVGDNGTGRFVQTGGSNSLWGTLYLGDYGTGRFVQTGGDVTVRGGLYLGNHLDANGIYELSGSGSLGAAEERIGLSGAGTFRQDGGMNSVGLLQVGPNGRYEYTGGVLDVRGGLALGGAMDLKGAAAVMDWNGVIVDLGQGGEFQNAQNASLLLGASSLVIVSPGVDPNTGLGTYRNDGMTHEAGSTLTVPAGQGFAGCGTIYDPVRCYGTIQAAAGLWINLTGGLQVFEGAAVDLGSGELTVNDANSAITGGSLAEGTLSIGKDATGRFTQTGGRNDVRSYLRLGDWASGDGTLELSGDGQLSAGYEYVGNQGTGRFIQTGGTNTIRWELYLGEDADSNGTYDLSGDGQLSAGSEFVGHYGTGRFTQTGGRNDTRCSVYFGLYTGGNGTYELSGDGQLWAGSEFVGYYGTGRFIQTGGTNVVSSSLSIGAAWSGDGTYELSGTGQVVANEERIGPSGAGVFRQDGGENSVGCLEVGANGRYEYTAGVLDLRGGLVLGGEMDLTGSPLVMDWDGVIVDLSRGGHFQNAQNASLLLGSSSLVIVSPGVDPNTGLGTYRNDGMTHEAGSTLTVPAGQGFAGCGTIYDPVRCYGMIQAAAGLGINLTGGLQVFEGAAVDLGTRGLSVTDANSGMTGGRLAEDWMSIGGDSNARFAQTGGTHVVRQELGVEAGKYELTDGGQLSAGTEYVSGSGGDGRFIQSGGCNTTGELHLETWSDANATYELSGGQLRAALEAIRQGGRMSHTGGLNQVRGGLVIDASYELGGTGRLRVDGGEWIGFEGAGAVVQDGGSHVVAGEFILGPDWQQEGTTGTYEIRAGELLVDDDVTIGDGGTGHFVQSGGSVTVDEDLEVGAGGRGTYELSDGLLRAEVESIGQDGGSGTFLQTGGENRTLALTVGPAGRYVLTGGTLQVGWSMYLAGEWDFDACSVNVTWDNAIVDLSDGSVLNAHNASLTLTGSNTLVILAPGQDPNAWFAHYVNAGQTHVTSGPLVVGEGEMRTWHGLLSVPVHCQGTIQAPPGEAIGLAGSVAIDGNGWIDVGWGSLWMSSGVSTLGGNGRLETDEVGIGDGGQATFIQTGGVNVTNGLWLGDDGEGTYELRGGRLSGAAAYLGDWGTGTFIQTGGTAEIGRLVLTGWEGVGTYELRDGNLVAQEVRVGMWDSREACRFVHTGGTATIGMLRIGSDQPKTWNWEEDWQTGRYVLNEGAALEIVGGLALAGGGELHLDGCSIDLTWDSVVLDFSQGKVVGAQNASLTVLGADSLVILSPDQEPGEFFGTFSNAGWTHIGGLPLVVPDGNSQTWAGEIREHVICRGTIAAPPGKGLTLAGGLVIEPNASVDLGQGALFVNDHVSRLEPNAHLTAREQFVGYSDGGTFTQAGGESSLDILALGRFFHAGQWDGDEAGTYNMEGGTLTAEIIFLGGGDEDLLSTDTEPLLAGVFNLSGGVVNVGELRMGYAEYADPWGRWRTGVDEFNFDGGTLKAGAMNFDLQQRGGVLAVGRSIGTTHIDGSYALQAGTLAIELGGNDNSDANHPQYDVLAVAGGVQLAGTLSLSWVPIAGEPGSKFGGPYDLLTYGGVLFGQFQDIAGNIGSAYVAGTDYAFALPDGNSAIRITLYALIDGDTDVDGDVDYEDYKKVLQNFTQVPAGKTWWEADFDCDGDVDYEDYKKILQNFGRIPEELPPGPTAAPEPGTLLLLAAGGLVLLRRRRR